MAQHRPTAPDEHASLLLLHGLGGNAQLWHDVARSWPGPVIAPDLAGHGDAPRLAGYEFDDHITDLIGRVGPLLARRTVVAAGHSFGALLLLALIPRLDATIFTRALILSTKTIVSETDIESIQRPGHRGIRWYDNEAAAREAFARSTGLSRTLPPNHPAAAHGIANQDGRWRLKTDTAAYLFRLPAIAPLFEAQPCPLILARGDQDDFATHHDMARFAQPVHTLAGCGHNPHVENPDAVTTLLT